MAGSAGRRLGRALRAAAVLGVTTVALGLGLPQFPADPVDPVASPPALSAGVFAAADVDTADLRPALPRGYGTVAGRAAQAAAEAETAAVAVAAAQAAAAATAKAEAAAARPAASVGRPSASSAVPSAVAGSGLPLGVDPGSSDQVVTVVASSSGATTATLTAWERRATGWTAALGPVTARIGRAGVGQAAETSTRTPAGTFALSGAFGRAADPGSGLPYRVVDGDDWWVSDQSSPRYNQYARCARNSCDFDESASENLYEEPAYEYAVVFDYNRNRTPGAGSAFFLHVSNGAPTAGCVAIDAGSLVAVLRWLEPASRPVIAIGVG